MGRKQRRIIKHQNQIIKYLMSNIYGSYGSLAAPSKPVDLVEAGLVKREDLIKNLLSFEADIKINRIGLGMPDDFGIKFFYFSNHTALQALVIAEDRLPKPYNLNLLEYQIEDDGTLYLWEGNPKDPERLRRQALENFLGPQVNTIINRVAQGRPTDSPHSSESYQNHKAIDALVIADEEKLTPYDLHGTKFVIEDRILYLWED